MNAASRLAPLPAPAEMAAWDRAAIAMGLPETMLMENAARAAFDALAQSFGDPDGKNILLFMGGGNNGGDAACLARHLLDAGANPLVLHIKPPGACKGAAARHIAMARACGVPFMPARKARASLRAPTPPVNPMPEFLPEAPADSHARQIISAPDIVVDGLLGTGLSGPVKNETLQWIRQINRLGQKAFVLALDIPSGLDGLGGKPLPEAVRADATITFQAAKPGLLAPEAATFTGRLFTRAIGIPAVVQKELPPARRLIDIEGCRRIIAESRSRPGNARPGAHCALHKGTFGHVLIIGGAPGLTGAPHLAALAALRSGAGLATIAAPAGLCAEIKAGNPNIMTLPLPCGGNWEAEKQSPSPFAALAGLAPRCRSLVIGPGLGRSPGAAALLREILAVENRPPAIIDADALFALAGLSEAGRLLRAGDILTPHPGEAARLLGVSTAEVQGVSTDGTHDVAIAKEPGISATAWAQGGRERAALALVEKYPAHAILKGAGSLVAGKGAPLALAPYDVPQLAVAGSGDVLAGCVAALLAGGMEPYGAAACGVMLHVLAGMALAKDFPSRGNTASEIAERLPEAIVRLNTI